MLVFQNFLAVAFFFFLYKILLHQTFVTSSCQCRCSWVRGGLTLQPGSSPAHPCLSPSPLPDVLLWQEGSSQQGSHHLRSVSGSKEFPVLCFVLVWQIQVLKVGAGLPASGYRQNASPAWWALSSWFQHCMCRGCIGFGPQVPGWAQKWSLRKPVLATPSVVDWVHGGERGGCKLQPRSAAEVLWHAGQVSWPLLPQFSCV